MTKSTYNVEGGSAQGRTDTSFRACVLIMLVFILLCSVLILIAWFLKANKQAPVDRERPATNGAVDKSKWEHSGKDSAVSSTVKTETDSSTTSLPTPTKSTGDTKGSDRAGPTTSTIPGERVDPVSVVTTGSTTSTIPGERVDPVSVVTTGPTTSTIPEERVDPVIVVTTGSTTSTISGEGVDPDSVVTARPTTSTISGEGVDPDSGVTTGSTTSTISGEGVDHYSVVTRGSTTSTISGEVVDPDSIVTTGSTTSTISGEGVDPDSVVTAGSTKSTISGEGVDPDSVVTAGSTTSTISRGVDPDSVVTTGSTTSTISGEGVDPDSGVTARSTTSTILGEGVDPDSGVTAGSTTTAISGEGVDPDSVVTTGSTTSTISGEGVDPDSGVTVGSTTSTISREGVDPDSVVTAGSTSTISGEGVDPDSGVTTGSTTSTISREGVDPDSVVTTGSTTSTISGEGVDPDSVVTTGSTTSTISGEGVDPDSVVTTGSTTSTISGEGVDPDSVVTTGSTTSIISGEGESPDSGVTVGPPTTTFSSDSDIFTTPTSDIVKECTTAECKTLASVLLGLMGHSAKPCVNFYKYACGGLQTNPSLQEDDLAKNVWDKIEGVLDSINERSSNAFKQFKNVYSSCVSYNPKQDINQWIEEVNNTMEAVGSFYNESEWKAIHDTTTYNYNKLLLQLFRHNSAPVFDVMLDVDGLDTNNFTIKLTVPLLRSPFKIEKAGPYSCKKETLELTKDADDLSSIYGEYISCMKKSVVDVSSARKALETLEIFPTDSNGTKRVANIIFEYGQYMEKFVTALPEESEKRNAVLSKEYKLVDVKYLKAHFHKVDWEALLTDLLGKTISEETKVQLYFESYFEALFNLLNSSSPWDVHNTLLTAFVQDLYYFLQQEQSPCNRNQYCLKVTTELMEDVASGAYLSTFEKREIEAKREITKKMFTQIKDTFSWKINNVSWLDSESRSNLISKLDGLTLTMDNGEELFTKDTYLDERLDGYNLSSSNFVKNAVDLLRRYRQYMYTPYGDKPEDPKHIWSHFLQPFSTSGIIIYGLNTIVIPLGMLSKPFYDPNYPEFVNMARLGYVLAHEMAHHFDTVGINYGTKGKKDDLLTHGDTNDYNLMKDSYFSSYRHSMTREAEDGKNVLFSYLNSKLSLNERIADDTAALLTYEVYRNLSHEKSLPFLGLTNDQVFYLHLAQTFCSKKTIYTKIIPLFEDEHLPPLLRVNHIAYQSGGFVETFKCRRGTGLIPSTQWGVFPAINPDEYDGPDAPPALYTSMLTTRAFRT